MPDSALDVVIVSYRSRQLVDRCLESLERFPAPGGMTVTVVDNAGDDGTAELIRDRHPGARVLPQRRNLGFAAGSNLGIRAGRSPYVLVLNPDAAVESGTLERLLDVLETRPEVGCCGPALFREDGSFDHAARRSFPTPMSALGHFSGVGRRARGGPLAAYRAPDVERGRVDAVNGAFMLLRRDALEQVGLFDEGYWMYMEDLDLCRRLAEAGWVTWYEPSARALHTKAGTTAGQRGTRLQIAFHRGMGRFYRRHYAPDHSAAFNCLVYVGIGAKLATSLAANALRR